MTYKELGFGDGRGSETERHAIEGLELMAECSKRSDVKS